MKVLLLAAGYATRLYPLTLNKPKPLLLVAGRTVLEFIFILIEPLKDVDETFIVTNKKFYKNFQKWNSKYSSSKKITIINDGTTSDKDKLGATGDIDFVITKENLKDDLLVLAGDNIFRTPLAGFIDFSVSKRPSVSVGLYDVKDLRLAKKYGIVTLDKDKKITEFKEKPANPTSTLAAKCLYFLPRERLGILKEYMKTGRTKDAPGYFLEWLYKREEVFGYVFEGGKWFDIGDRKSYEDADKTFRELKGEG